MSEALLNILVLTGTLIIISVIFLVVNHRKKAQEQVLQKIASEHEWQLFFIRESLRSGLVITNNIWRFDSTSTSSGRESGPGSSDFALLTTWSVRHPGKTVIINSKPANASLNSAAINAAQALIQVTSATPLHNLQPSQAGSALLRQRYAIWTQDEASAAQLLTADVERRLLQWHGMPLLIRQDAEGLHIEIKGLRTDKHEEILSIIQLGQSLSAGWISENAIIENG